MTSHAGLLAPSDVWLTDQLAGWLQDLEQYFTDYDRMTEVFAALPLEQMASVRNEQSLRMTVLLCTARQLVAEVLTRGS